MSERIELEPEQPSRLLASDLFNELCSHALDVAPEECCGFIMGRADEPYCRVVRISNVMTKMHVADPKTFPRDARHAYYMSEVEYLRAIEDAEARTEFVAAVYHSHFGQGCYLSQDDLAFAAHPLFPFPEAQQVVLSLLADRVSEVGLFERSAEAPGGFVGRKLEALH